MYAGFTLVWPREETNPKTTLETNNPNRTSSYREGQTVLFRPRPNRLVVQSHTAPKEGWGYKFLAVCPADKKLNITRCKVTYLWIFPNRGVSVKSINVQRH